MTTRDKTNLIKAIQNAGRDDLQVLSLDSLSAANRSTVIATLERFLRSKRSDYSIIAIRKK
jgi:hypothetical protein